MSVKHAADCNRTLKLDRACSCMPVIILWRRRQRIWSRIIRVGSGVAGVVLGALAGLHAGGVL